MQNITIIAVGKGDRDYLRPACAEYEKRLSRLCNLKIVNIQNENLPEKNLSEKSIKNALEKEGNLMLEKMPPKSYNIAMCIEGKTIDSVSLAEKIAKISVDGISTINFIIGSSFGLCDKIKQKANFKMSMSPMTFPHQLARIMLLEQIYRAFKINRNESYHK